MRDIAIKLASNQEYVEAIKYLQDLGEEVNSKYAYIPNIWDCLKYKDNCPFWILYNDYEGSSISLQEFKDKYYKKEIGYEEKLVKSKLSQMEACSICKYHNNCENNPKAKVGGFCPANNGMYYPRDKTEDFWCVKITEENKEIVGKFYADMAWEGYYDRIIDNVGIYYTSHNVSSKTSIYDKNPGTNHALPNATKDFPEITTKEFYNKIGYKEVKKDIVVNVKTQEEWDYVSAELEYTWRDSGWKIYKEASCISIKKNEYCFIKYYEGINYQVISFTEWLEMYDIPSPRFIEYRVSANTHGFLETKIQENSLPPNIEEEGKTVTLFKRKKEKKNTFISQKVEEVKIKKEKKVKRKFIS